MGLIITYVKLGWRCNTNCVFCAVGGESGPQELPTDVVLDQLRLGRQYGATMLTISGGEPTIRSDLLNLIAAARVMGFTGIQVQTNGRALASQDYCGKLLESGVAKFIVSLHGHVNELHDRLTQTRGSFEQTSRGISNLTRIKSIPPILQTNTTIVTDNYRFLPEIVRYLEVLSR